jgi:DNA polymerase IV
MSGPGKSIVHIDMDAFYASVEQRDRPELRGKPVIVGGHAQRGVVLAASYEARPFGVRSAMPMAQALKLAPHAIVVPPKMGAYAEASDAVFAIFERYTPLIEPLSLDEAFLDVTASQSLFGSATDIARAIRRAVASELSLPASAGIASVKFLAKIASDLAKPNGQREVPPGQEQAFLAPLPISRLWGVGVKTEAILKSLGLHTIGDVASQDPTWLTDRLGPQGTFFYELSRGIDPRVVVPDRAAKSIGAEDTFDQDLDSAAALAPHIHEQALRVGRRLRRSKMKTRVVQLKLKLHDFTVLTRRTTLETPTDDGQTLYRAALELLERSGITRPVRLTGVSAQDLRVDGPQLSLFSESKRSRADRLNAALDKIQERFGRDKVTTADVVATQVRRVFLSEDEDA